MRHSTRSETRRCSSTSTATVHTRASSACYSPRGVLVTASACRRDAPGGADCLDVPAAFGSRARQHACTRIKTPVGVSADATARASGGTWIQGHVTHTSNQPGAHRPVFGDFAPRLEQAPRHRNDKQRPSRATTPWHDDSSRCHASMCTSNQPLAVSGTLNSLFQRLADSDTTAHAIRGLETRSIKNLEMCWRNLS